MKDILQAGVEFVLVIGCSLVIVVFVAALTVTVTG